LKALSEVVQEVVGLAQHAGATSAECTAGEGTEFSATVRNGEVDKLTQAGSREISVRVFRGLRTGAASTSDLSEAGLQRMVSVAMENATVTMEDPEAQLLDARELGKYSGDLRLRSPELEALDPHWKIEQARMAEAAALQADPRISSCEAASFDTQIWERAFATSHGFAGSYASTYAAASVVPVARSGERMERDYWYTVARDPAALEAPAQLGKIASERVLRRLGARRIPTGKAPVLFDPRMTRSLLSSLASAVNGDNVWRDSSYLARHMGEQIASPLVTVVDDGTLPGWLGSVPFDAEGAPARRTTVIENGVLRSWLLNGYAARKLGLRTTGNAVRDNGVGPHNFILSPGAETQQELMRRMGRGLFVFELMGHGVNVVTGDYSRGAAGLWIENGEPAFPVSEITIAGHLRQMLMNITAIGSDVDHRAGIVCPSILIGEMMISGE
jgi:PmbA protein